MSSLPNSGHALQSIITCDKYLTNQRVPLMYACVIVVERLLDVVRGLWVRPFPTGKSLGFQGTSFLFSALVSWYTCTLYHLK